MSQLLLPRAGGGRSRASRRRTAATRLHGAPSAASAHTFLLSSDLLGDLGIVFPEELERYGWPSLALLAGHTLRNLAVLREAHGEQIPALNLLARVRVGSSSTFQGFVDELGEEIGRLVAKYHDKDAPAGDHWFFLGAYPGS